MNFRLFYFFVGFNCALLLKKIIQQVLGAGVHAINAKWMALNDPRPERVVLFYAVIIELCLLAETCMLEFKMYF